MLQGCTWLFVLFAQFIFSNAQLWTVQGAKEVKWFATKLCRDSKAKNGTCVTLQACFSDARFPHLSGWSEFVSGDYDSCAYITERGVPFVGACCTRTMGSAEPEALQPAPAFPGLPTDSPIVMVTEPPRPPTMPSPPSRPPAHPGIPPNWPPTHPPLPTHPPFITHPPTSRKPFPWPWFTPHPTKPTTTTTVPPTPVVPWWSKPDPSPPVEVTPIPGGEAQKCGVREDAFRVVGGQTAGYWPWMAGIVGRRGLFCGGSLLSNYHVLTAAHCVRGLTPSDMTVRLGDRDLSTTNDYNHLDVKVSDITIHPSYSTKTNHHDVAILRLASKVTFNAHIQPLCLPVNNSLHYAGQNAIVIGWGATRIRGPTSKVLMELNLRVWSVSECQTKFQATFPGQIVPTNVCAGDGGKDACSGDSGGPLMKYDNGVYTQIGVVSWGVGCGTYHYPGVYTRVTSYLSWIKSNLI